MEFCYVTFKDNSVNSRYLYVNFDDKKSIPLKEFLKIDFPVYLEGDDKKVSENNKSVSRKKSRWNLLNEIKKLITPPKLQ